MAFLHDNRGHFIVLVFYLVFGAAFLGTSIAYFLTLEEKPQGPFSGTKDHTKDETTDASTNDNEEEDGDEEYDPENFKLWRAIAITGMAYGSICFAACLGKVYTILKRYYGGEDDLKNARDPHQSGPSSPIEEPSTTSAALSCRPLSSAGSLKTATGGEEIKRAHEHLLEIIGKRPRRQIEQGENAEAVMTCLMCLAIWMEYFMIILLWVFTVVLPLFFICGIIVSQAIRVNDDTLYGLALAILCLAIANLTLILGSPVLILMERDQIFEITPDLEGEGGGKKVAQLKPRKKRGWGIFSPFRGTREEQEPLIPTATVA